MATRVEETIEVAVPVSTAYNQWTQFEEFPQFMGGVQRVEQRGPQMTHWVAQVGGVKREWDAAILEQVPDTKVAWAATEGATNAGAVFFTALSADRTVVRLTLEYEPEGLVEKAGDALGVVERRAKADLEKFKEFIESRGTESGGWRGSVNEGVGLGAPGVEAAEASRGDSGAAGVTKGAAVAGAAVLAGAAAAGVAAVRSHKGGEEEDVRPEQPVETVQPVQPTQTAQTAQPIADLGAQPVAGAGALQDEDDDVVPVDPRAAEAALAGSPLQEPSDLPPTNDGDLLAEPHRTTDPGRTSL